MEEFFQTLKHFKTALGQSDYSGTGECLNELKSICSRLNDPEYDRFLGNLDHELEYYCGLGAGRCGGLAQLVEPRWRFPHAIFLLKSGERTLVGRKILSHRWIRGEITQLHCSLLSADMILGDLRNFQTADSSVVIFYESIGRDEREQIVKQLPQDQSAHVHFPFPPEDKLSGREQCTPSTGWELPEYELEALDRGEEHFRAQAIQRIGDRVLSDELFYDPACSTGTFLNTLQRRYPGVRTVGQDLSATMIDIARGKLDEAHVGDARQPAVANDAVDRLFVRFLNMEVVDTHSAYQLFVRLIETVKPGGRIYMFGHTPVLITPEACSLFGLEVLGALGFADQHFFQFYELAMT